MRDTASPLLGATDKAIWHGYVDFYESTLPPEIEGLIVEFGVFHGQSIRWLADRYPKASVIGVDILDQMPDWPVGDRIAYRKVDQASEAEVAEFFAEIESPALVIEDGSHTPSHQSRCLRVGFDRLIPGGTYVLEDIHTSHPAHPYYRQEFGFHLPGAIRGPLRPGLVPQTALSVLLAVEHRRRLGDALLSDETVRALAKGTHFTDVQIRSLDVAIDEVLVFRRATLPSSCYRCGGSDFDYHRYRCRCGTDLLAAADSTSVVIRKRK